MEPRPNRRQAVVKGVTGLPHRPGWEPIAAAADKLAARSDRDARQRFENGALDLVTSTTQALKRSGIRRFARELAAETCDRCGRPGERVNSGEAGTPGTRCARCRGLDDRIVPRQWTLPKRAIPVTDAGAEEHYSRPLTEYWGKGGLEELMNAHHEPGWFGSGACDGTKGGWNHLLRALVAAWLHPDAGGGAERLRITDLKEKFGALSILAGPLNEVRAGSLNLATEMSTLVCNDCGAPGTWRKSRPGFHSMGTTCDRCMDRMAAHAATPMDHLRRMLIEQQIHTGSPQGIEDSLARLIKKSGFGLEVYASDARQQRCKH